MSNNQPQHNASPAPTIRDATSGDLPALTAALTPDVSHDQLTNRFHEARSSHRHMLIAEVDGSPVGTVSFDTHSYAAENTIRLFALDVGRHWQRRGIGTALVNAVETRAAQLGHQKIILEVALSNTLAIALYKRLGYRRSGAPFLNHWTKLDGGERIEVAEESVLMEKELNR